MNQTLPEVVTEILMHNGAVVERQDDGTLEIIVPDEISSAINIPEYARLSFSCVEHYREAIYASYDSEFFHDLRRLFKERGAFSVARFEPYMPNMEKLSRVIPEKIPFGNATFRLGKTDTSMVSYLLILFRYIALSDEKHEGILPLLINELNLSSVTLESNISDLMSDLKGPDPVQGSSPLLSGREDTGTIKVLQAAHISAINRVTEKMREFIKSLERRLNRDIKRVYEYYGTLKKEARTAIKRKVAEYSDLKSETGTLDLQGLQNISDYLAQKDREIDKKIDDRTIRGEGIEKILNKLDAIERERQWKVQDLIEKYTLTVQAEPVSLIRIKTLAPLFMLNIKRRLASRSFPLTYNPIIRQLDILPCESCFNPHGSYYICDDRLHIICGNCFKVCSTCGRQYCNACFNDRCPKCKK